MCFLLVVKGDVLLLPTMNFLKALRLLLKTCCHDPQQQMKDKTKIVLEFVPSRFLLRTLKADFFSSAMM